MKVFFVVVELSFWEMIIGFENTHEGCCGSGVLEIGLLCNENTVTCHDPSKYIFWDAAHPTQAAYDIIVKQFQNVLLPRLMS